MTTAPASPAAASGTGSDVLDTPGSAISGYTPPTVTPGESTEAQIAAAWQEYQNNPALQQSIQQEYGDESWAMSIPELAQIVVAGALYGWDQGEMDGAISQTNWYKTASQSMRTWETLQATDPATAQAQLDASMWQVNQIETQAGLSLSVQQEQNLARQANMFGWDSDTLEQVILNTYANQLLTNNASTASPGPGTAGVNTGGATPASSPGTSGAIGGTAGTFADQAQQLVGQYLVPMSPQAINDWTVRAVKGQVNIQGLENSLRQQAAQLYPWMSPALAQGLTPQQYLQPYTQAAASTLSISPDQVDWTNPKWMSALLSPTTDSSTGASSPLNVDQFTTAIRKDPTFGYQNTVGAMQQSYALASTILNTFGKVAS